MTDQEQKDFLFADREYDYHLGLTDDQRAVVEALDCNKLSHYLEYDDVNLFVETWARHTETNERYLTRRRPMVGEEVRFAIERLAAIGAKG